jgi:hypothetical protein
MEKKGGYGIVYKDVIRSKSLTPEAKAIYSYLCVFAGSDDSCYPGLELMRSELQMSSDRFYKHMRLLTESGIVTKSQERNGNRWGHTVYTLNHDPNFQLSQNKQTDNKQTQNKQTNSKQTQNKQTNSKQTQNKQTNSKQTNSKQTQSKEYNNTSLNNTSLNNTSLNNTSLNNTLTVNEVDQICYLLNKPREYKGGDVAKGRLQPKGFYKLYDSLLNDGVTYQDMIGLAEELANNGDIVYWYDFYEMLKEKRREETNPPQSGK